MPQRAVELSRGAKERIELKGSATHESEGRNLDVRDQQTQLIELRSPGGCLEKIAITPYLVRDRADIVTYQACRTE
jgi:hypothetical protein